MPKKITAEKIKSDYKRASRFGAKWSREAKEDLRYCLGDQWKKEIKDELEKSGRPALTLNIIQPNIRLVTGHQREARSSIRAYPEGGEDQLTSEVATRLLKHIIKQSKAENIISTTFETALMARGKAFIEPYTDHTYDLIHGTIKFKILDGWQVKIDPNSVEYDLSDARYLTKEIILEKDELIELYPDKERVIDDLETSPSDELETDVEDRLLEENEDYPGASAMDSDMPGVDEKDEEKYKLIIYYYKKYFTQYLAIDANRSQAKFFDTKAKAEKFLKLMAAVDMPAVKTKKKPKLKDIKLQDGQKVIPRKIPQIWEVALVGDTILNDDVTESWPNWKGYPLIPYFAWFSPVAKRVLKREELAYQGIASSLKDPQDEKNKRRSQALHIINSVANRGWKAEEGSWSNPNDVKKFGSTPGVTLYYKKGAIPPQELQPTSFPAAHSIFEDKSEEDIKKISGINADMLSVEDKTTSGRAIALRQKQGFTMLASIFDNLSWTQELVGKYIISQLPDLFTPDKAMRVLGGEFIDKNFRNSPTDPPELIHAKASEFINELLNDDELCSYDISVGEGLESPTERYAQFTSLLEMADRMIIPPQVLVEYSDFPESIKKQIIEAQTMMMAPPQENAPRKKKPAPATGK
jgi:hypothetical protein